MEVQPPSNVPGLGEVETRDWHPDEQNEAKPDDVLPFTSEQCDMLQQYIWDIRDMLDMHHWDIYLTMAPSSDDANASIHPVYGRHSAGLSVNKKWFDFSPEVQRNTIIHEILHVVHNRQTEMIRTTRQQSGVWTAFERETELMVDHLANAIDQFFPLPPKTVFEKVMEDLDALDKNDRV